MNTLFSKNKNILVIGDAILDIYHFSKVDRISPEAPVPVALVLKTEEKLGGAANVSNNIAHLNNETTLVAFAGEDQNAVILKNLLEDNKIEYNLKYFLWINNKRHYLLFAFHNYQEYLKQFVQYLLN